MPHPTWSVSGLSDSHAIPREFGVTVSITLGLVGLVECFSLIKAVNTGQAPQISPESTLERLLTASLSLLPCGSCGVVPFLETVSSCSLLTKTKGKADGFLGSEPRLDVRWQAIRNPVSGATLPAFSPIAYSRFGIPKRASSAETRLGPKVKMQLERRSAINGGSVYPEPRRVCIGWLHVDMGRRSDAEMRTARGIPYQSRIIRVVWTRDLG